MPLPDHSLSPDEIAQLTEQDWQKRLTADEYYVLRQKAPSDLLPAYIPMCLKLVCIVARAVMPSSLTAIANTTQAVAGPALIRQLTTPC